MSEKNSVLKWKIISAISTTCCIVFGALYFNKRAKEYKTIENDKVNSTNVAVHKEFLNDFICDVKGILED